MAHPTTEHRVAEDEVKLGRRLPGSLRNRLIEENGGEVETDGRYSESEEDSVWSPHAVADLIYDKKGRSWMGGGLADGTTSEAESFGPSWDVPEGTIVIGENGTGDRLLLLPDDRYAVRDHETGDVEPVGVRLHPGEGEYHEQAR